MAPEVHGIATVARRIALVGVCALGLLTIVGSGGGTSVDAPQCSFFSNVCNPTFEPTLLQSSAVDPARISVQVGSTVRYTVRTANIDNPSYQWKRSSDGGLTYAAIAGATGSSYTLAAANLGDDGARYAVDVRNGAGTLVVGLGVGAQGWSQLLVSALPGIVLQDGNFAPADWSETAFASPTSGGPTHAASQAPDGGNPGAYRLMSHVMPIGPSSLRVEHLSAGQAYDPATQGAIRAIDYREDCVLQANTTSTYRVSTQLLVEQGERRYTTGSSLDCATPAWSRMPQWSSLAATDFILLDGPACGSTQACPDFSASGAALRFGYMRASSTIAGVGGTLSHSIDNWTVTVWRR